ncbi:group II truncated hemoglobin [soil metagenome]
MSTDSLYEKIGGFDGILALTTRWHERCLANPDASHPFERGTHPQHNERFAAYLAEAFGGPALYTGGYGDESSVQKLHAGNEIHIELDEACMLEFDNALTDVGITGEAWQTISNYFRRATEAQRIYATQDAPVPTDLPFNYV